MNKDITTYRLGELESVIARGLTNFIEVGKALFEIRDKRLYREQGYKTFEKYCRERWHWGRKYADRQILAAIRVKNLTPMGVKNERQARALYSSDSAEWYTPQDVITRVERVLGAISLDPCANSEKTVPAKRHYTAEDDGLSQKWAGSVYMNPPYGREIAPWVEKLCGEHASGAVREAIALVPARVDTEWFRMFRDFAVCFLNGRLKFSGHENSAPFPSAVVYIGPDIISFCREFEEIGDIWLRVRT